MNEILKTILSLSVSGGLLALVLFALKPLYKNRLRKSWQYYIWLVVLLRMLLPLAPEANLFGFISSTGTISASQPEPEPYTSSDTPAHNENFNPYEYYTLQKTDTSVTPETQPASAQSTANLLPHIWFIFPIVSLFIMTRKTVQYYRYTKFIRAGCTQIHNDELPVPLYVNPTVCTPMLIGIVKPFIVLPDANYTNNEFAMILRHELIHYKRRDILYKWLLQAVISLHWFNPLVYLISKEINKNCELSCDEAVLSSLDETEKRTYGDALMAVIRSADTHEKINNTAIATAMSEDGRNLKERLELIMTFSQKSVIAIVLSAVLTIVLITGALFLGAYTEANAAGEGVLSASKSYNKLEDIGIALETNTESDTIIVHGLYKTYDIIKWKNAYKLNLNNGALSNTSFFNGQVMLLADEEGNEWKLAENEKLLISLEIDLSFDYSDPNGEYASVGYYNGNGEIFTEIHFGKIKDLFSLDFTAPQDGDYYIYLINLCAGTQNYKEIKISSIPFETPDITEPEATAEPETSHEPDKPDEPDEPVVIELSDDNSIQNHFTNFAWDKNLNNYYSTKMSELEALIFDEPRVHEHEFSSVTKLQIDVVNANINITKGGDKLFIRYSEWFEDEYSLKNNGSEWKLSSQSPPYYKKGSYVTNGWIFDYLKENRETPTPTIEIVIPEGMTLRIEADTIYGNVTVTDVILDGKLRADTINGAINVTGSKIEDRLILDTINGRIAVSGSTAAKLAADTVNGGIDITNCTVNGNLTADNNSGNIKITDSFIGGDLSASSLNSSVTAENNEVKGKTKIQDYSQWELNDWDWNWD